MGNNAKNIIEKTYFIGDNRFRIERVFCLGGGQRLTGEDNTLLQNQRYGSPSLSQDGVD